MKDMQGITLTVGCKVARAVLWGKTPRIEICTVTRINDTRLYLDESRQPMKFPERLLIVEQDEVFQMIDKYERNKALKDE